MKRKPYVSFVLGARNDGYTTQYIERVSRATKCLAGQLERAGLDSEIIISDWNSPPDRPLLIDSLDLPTTLRHVTVVGLVVPPEYHTGFIGSHERGIQAGAATNVGLRRARGRFISPKASDTFFSTRIIERIAQRDLDPDTMYRVDRHDVPLDDSSILELDDEALLAKLASLPSEVHAWIDQSDYWNLRDLHTNACGDFTLLSSAYWHLLGGYQIDKTVLSLDIDSLLMHAAAALQVTECRWPKDCKVFKPMHGNLNSSRVTQVWKPWQRFLDRTLSECLDMRTAHWFRTTLNYPCRRVRGITSVVGPSIERNFVLPASRWAKGADSLATRDQDWGLPYAALKQRFLCRADWDSAASVAAS